MNAIRFPFHFDARRIHQELQAIAESFQQINSLRIKKNHLQGMHLITPVFQSKNNKKVRYQSTPELDKSPYLRSVLDTFQCDKLVYRVHNLVAKGKIALHRDGDRGLMNGVVRIHIPVTTNDEVYFYVNGERIGMQNGECWFADITQFHKVENRSDTDRLQLMIDCDLNDWWKNLLKENGVQLEQHSEWNNHSLEELQMMKENLKTMGMNDQQTTIEKIDQAIAVRTQ